MTSQLFAWTCRLLLVALGLTLLFTAAPEAFGLLTAVFVLYALGRARGHGTGGLLGSGKQKSMDRGRTIERRRVQAPPLHQQIAPPDGDGDGRIELF